MCLSKDFGDDVSGMLTATTRSISLPRAAWVVPTLTVG
jgi:hypothetical protein